MTTIKIKDATLPCFPTMGGLVFYKRISGKNVTEINGEEDLITVCYAQTKAACKSDGVDFPYPDVDSFACDLSPDEFAKWCLTITGQEEETDSKKKKRRLKSNDS